MTATRYYLGTLSLLLVIGILIFKYKDSELALIELSTLTFGSTFWIVVVFVFLLIARLKMHSFVRYLERRETAKSNEKVEHSWLYKKMYSVRYFLYAIFIIVTVTLIVRFGVI